MLPPSGAVRRSDKARVMMGSGLPPFFHCLDHLLPNGLAFIRGPQTACDPDVTLAVNGKSAGAKARLEDFDLSRTRIGRRESAHPIADAALLTQIRSCWSIARWNGPRRWPGFSLGLRVLFTNSKCPLAGSPLGMKTTRLCSKSSAQISPLGVAIIPCISPSLPPKL